MKRHDFLTMTVVLGLGLGLAASTTTFAAQGDEGMIAASTNWAMAPTPIRKPPACFDPVGLQRYHPPLPALLDDGARSGSTTCFYGDTPNSRLLSGEQALSCDLIEEAIERESNYLIVPDFEQKHRVPQRNADFERLADGVGCFHWMGTTAGRKDGKEEKDHGPPTVNIARTDIPACCLWKRHG